ncbi:MAG: lipopolysaccharide biosynthesis protein [Verrucomicrobiota bacterium]|nr:lipopolysaccharide biosynthesis protein [Verrucomicrobiota bacterium]
MSLFTKALNSVKWGAVEQLSSQFLQLVVLLLLSRLVDKEVFGLIALTNVFCAFLQLFVRKGIGDAIIQKEKLSDGVVHTAFWSSLAVGVLLVVVACVGSPLLADLYDEPRISPIVSVLSISMLLGALSTVPLAILKREMRFRPIAIRSIAGRLIGGSVGIYMAFSGCGVWSLVAVQLVGDAVATLFLWLAGCYCPKFCYQKEHAKSLYLFGGKVIGTQLMNFLNRRYDVLIIGKFFGMETLGVYAVSMKIIDFGVNLFMGVFGQVGYPLMCRLNRDRVKFKEFMISSIVVISVLVTPFALSLYFHGDFWIIALLGHNWEDAIPISMLLSLILLIKLTSWSEGLAVIAMGHPGTRMKIAAFFACVSVLSLTAGAFIGLEWFALAACMRYFVAAIPMMSITARLADLRVLDILMSHLIPVSLGIVAIGGGCWLVNWSTIENPFASITLQLMSVSLYFVLIVAFVMLPFSYTHRLRSNLLSSISHLRS